VEEAHIKIQIVCFLLSHLQASDNIKTTLLFCSTTWDHKNRNMTEIFKYPYLWRTEVWGRQGRRYMQLLDYLKEKRAKGTTIHMQAYYRTTGFQDVKPPRFLYSRNMKVVRLSALCTSHLYPQQIFLVLIFFRGQVDPNARVRPEGLCPWNILWYQLEFNTQPSGL